MPCDTMMTCKDWTDVNASGNPNPPCDGTPAAKALAAFQQCACGSGAMMGPCASKCENAEPHCTVVLSVVLAAQLQSCISCLNANCSAQFTACGNN